jgi:hypothetical protein
VTAIAPFVAFPFDLSVPAFGGMIPMPMPWVPTGPAADIVAATDPAEDEDGGDEEDLVVAQPAEEESSFDDFDDEFDDDFEEDATDPDWDHPDDGDAEPPPGKGGGKKK